MAANERLLVIARQAQQRLEEETQGLVDALTVVGPELVRDSLSVIWTLGARIGIERAEAELGVLRIPVPAPRLDVYNPRKIDALARDVLKNLKDPSRRRFVRMSGEAARDESFVDGHRLTMKEADAGSGLVWVSQMDAATCLTCRSRHGNKVTSILPPAHPNCRCLAVSSREAVPLSAVGKLYVSLAR